MTSFLRSKHKKKMKKDLCFVIVMGITFLKMHSKCIEIYYPTDILLLSFFYFSILKIVHGINLNNSEKFYYFSLEKY